MVGVMGGPLEGWQVLDLSQGVTGPYLTKLCSDYGADVIKVERPGMGDVSRRIGPFPGDDPHPEKSGMFLSLNTGKRSVTLNLATRTGRELLLALAARADLIVESFRPGTMERFGLSPDRLAEAGPAALVRISNFGQNGPWREFTADDLVEYAASGVFQVTGMPDRHPVALGLYTSLFLAGAICAPHALGAMRAAHRDKQQEVLDFSIQEGLAGSMDRGGPNLVSYQYTGHLSHPRQASRRRNSALPSGVYRCADGYIQVNTLQTWSSRVFRVIGRPEWIDDERITGHLNDVDGVGPEIEAAFLAWLRPLTKQHAMEQAQAQGWPLSALNTPADVMRDPHMRERGFFVTVDHPEAGPVELPGLALRFTGTPGELRRPPLLGEHNLEIFGELGYTPPEVAALRTQNVI
jgi:crotonobetainyl-CoA:carnitine CoA-transferase CaiB-like acyl-CoA transferase